MNKDYQNFGERMGSFEDDLDISGENLMHSDKLSHFGIKGMHWGHRSGNTINNVKWKSSDGSSNNPFKMNATTLGAAARTGQSAAQLGQAVNRNSYNKKTLHEAKNMSDDDLKKLTNRLNLENNYMNAKNLQSGKGKVENILSIAGGALAVASSAAILYDTVNKFK